LIVTTQRVGGTSGIKSAFFGTAAVGCFVYSAFVLLLMHVLRPDYTPVDHMISDYAVGPYGWVMTTAWLAMSCGCAMLMLGFFRDGPASIPARLGAVLLGVASIGLLVTAIFPTDLQGAPATRSGDIHNVSFLVNVGSIFVATVLLAASFGSDLRWRAYQRTAIALTLLVVVAFVLQFLTLHRGMPFGIANRFFVIVLFTWFLTTAIRLRAVATGISAK
jgi:hypothetical membrane protein